MERRRSERINFNLDCELASRCLNLTGFVENLSENGLSVNIDHSETTGTIPQGEIFTVKMEVHSVKTLNMDCKVVRSFTHSQRSSAKIIGMEIIGQSPEYKEFFNSIK